MCEMAAGGGVGLTYFAYCLCVFSVHFNFPSLRLTLNSGHSKWGSGSESLIPTPVLSECHWKEHASLSVALDAAISLLLWGGPCKHGLTKRIRDVRVLVSLLDAHNEALVRIS